MKYGCTPINVTRLGDYVFDKELADLDDEERTDDGDFSDWRDQRIERETEIVEKW
jgi:hypothetical protein